MPGILPQNSILKKTFLFKLLAKTYDIFILRRQYIKTNATIRTIPDDVHHFYFFPFYHTGGAEKVHADIIKSIHPEKQVVFFTDRSADDKFKSSFWNHAKCIDLFYLLRNDKYREKVLDTIIHRLNRTSHNIVFSSNSIEFYQTIVPALNDQNTCVDLIHAFVHEGEPGSEYWSLPVTEKLQKRVVVCNAVKQNLQSHYLKYNIDPVLNDRIEIIYNKVDINDNNTYNQKDKQEFNVLCIGRNSPEKRVNLMIEVAAELTQITTFDFFFIGPGMDELINIHGNPRIHFIGNSSTDEIYKYYTTGHALLLLSSREGLPLVLLEAMSCGVVPVCTDVGGIGEFVKVDTGFLIDCNNDDIRKNAVSVLMELYNNRGLLERLSANCVALINKSSSSAKFSESYNTILKY